MACCHPGVGGPIGRHDSHFPSGPNNGSAIASTIEAASAPGLCISGTPGLSISEKKPMLGLSPRGQSANRPVYGRAVAWGRHDVAFCTRHYMRCPAPPRPAARINSRAPAY